MRDAHCLALSWQLRSPLDRRSYCEGRSLPHWLEDVRSLRGSVLFDNGRRPHFRTGDGRFCDADPIDLYAYHIFVHDGLRLVGCVRVYPLVLNGLPCVTEKILGQKTFSEMLQQPANFDAFRNIPPSKVTGVPQTGRLTNLQQLSVDTSWWVRYRSTTNPDLGAIFTQQAVQGLNVGQHPAIPVTNADLLPAAANHLQAIANTAGFHFGFIEQAGTSLYATLSQKVTSAEVLKITISIGGAEIMHFQVWHDKAGNAPALTDHAITFVDLTKNQPERLQANLIMPEPCDFISKGLPHCAIIRPTSPGQLDARGAIHGFIADGLFIGQQRSKEFLDLIIDMAEEADAVRRELDE